MLEFPGGGGDCAVHGRAWCLDDRAVARSQAGWLQVAEPAGALEAQASVPGRKPGHRVPPGHHGAGGYPASGGEGVPGVQGAVAGVEEGEVAGGMSRGGHHPQGADHLAVGNQPGRAGGGGPETAAHRTGGLVVACLGVACQQRRLPLGGDYLDAGQRRGERVQRAVVVAVGVGQHDAHDGQPQRGGAREDQPVGAGQAGIDQREPVVLDDQVLVDEAQPGDAVDARLGRPAGVVCCLCHAGSFQGSLTLD